MNKTNYKLIFYLFIVVSFLVLSFLLYAQPITYANEKSNYQANNGKLIWQKNNCSACHQIYGLGGYLGPDLTNYTFKKENNIHAFRGIIKGGNKQMPIYELDEQEITDLYTFLSCLNESGNGNPFLVKKTKWGMISNE